MRHIEVAAENDRLGLLQLLAIGKEGRIPVLESQRQAAEIVLGVRRVNRHDIEFLEFRRHDPAFLGAVALQFIGEREAFCKLEGKAVDDGQRFLFRKNRGARIPLLHGGIPVLAVIGQIDLELSTLGLGLLQTDDIGPKLLQKRLKHLFLDHGANAVDIPGKNLHCISRPMVMAAEPKSALCMRATPMRASTVLPLQPIMRGWWPISAARSLRRWVRIPPNRRPGPCTPRPRTWRWRWRPQPPAPPPPKPRPPPPQLPANPASRLRIPCAPGPLS